MVEKYKGIQIFCDRRGEEELRILVVGFKFSNIQQTTEENTGDRMKCIGKAAVNLASPANKMKKRY